MTDRSADVRRAADALLSGDDENAVALLRGLHEGLGPFSKATAEGLRRAGMSGAAEVADQVVSTYVHTQFIEVIQAVRLMMAATAPTMDTSAFVSASGRRAGGTVVCQLHASVTTVITAALYRAVPDMHFVKQYSRSTDEPRPSRVHFDHEVTAAFELARHVRNGGSACILVDVPEEGPRSTEVTVLGVPVRYAIGAEWIAQRTGARLLAVAQACPDQDPVRLEARVLGRAETVAGLFELFEPQILASPGSWIGWFTLVDFATMQRVRDVACMHNDRLWDELRNELPTMFLPA